jgi:uncharacterized protein
VILRRVVELVGALREAGVPVALSEAQDAYSSLGHIPLQDRAAFKAALAASLIKTPAHRRAFDTLFELYFGATSPSVAEPSGSEQTREEFIEELIVALREGDTVALGDLARRAVTRFGQLESSRSKDWYSHYEVVRALGLNTLAARAAAVSDPEAPSGDPLTTKLARDEFERRLRRFREETLVETRRRVAQQRGPAAVAAYAVGPLPEDVDFLSATAEMADLRRAVHPLARKLATRLSMKRRKAARGQLDMRKTVRHSLSAGGVPLDTLFKNRAPHRPEIFILCDVSSSVARFSRFALMLTHALAGQFSNVRSFAFVDSLDEVTRHFATEDFAAALRTMNQEAKVVGGDGHSDYGASLGMFLQRFGREIGPKTTLMILGDARTNYRGDNAWALAQLTDRVHRSYWLNPEPTQDWDSGDSVASRYAAHVDAMVEVRNLRQLEAFIAERL